MSYDISLVIDTGSSEPVEVVEVGNYTSNVAPMWQWALGVRLRDYDGVPCDRALAPLRDGIRRMQAAPDFYRPLTTNPEWGDYEGALNFLVKLTDACEANPKCTIEIDS
ncbi:hypothetical protein [Nocardiopsis synnemataformans]|uniref:hypothetical protein n=1 Tax=Nocardiopsis synnemataformans TaxID=61305 RepID=UPI003EBB5C50